MSPFTQIKRRNNDSENLFYSINREKIFSNKFNKEHVKLV